MIDNLGSDMQRQTNNIKSSSIKFPISQCDIPGNENDINILSMSCSKKYLYLVTDKTEILCLESKTLNPVQQSFSITSSPSPNSPFKENFTKIWTDREGNHNIIRYKGKIYYFNLLINEAKELESFKNIEICAIGFDDKNQNDKSTGLFLAADYNNNIYECQINLEKKSNDDYKIIATKKKLTQLVFKDWDTLEEEEYSEPRKINYERIYGIKFVKTTKLKIKPNDNIYYIIFVTKTKIYQFKGPGEKTFLQCFEKFNNNDMLFNDCCKYFPHVPKISKIFTGTDIDFVYINGQNLDQFGWKTESGYCIGNFNVEYLPNEVNSFTVIPFEKINKQGEKEFGLEPLSVTQTLNHIFVLYDDCLTVISKLTSNIIHTEYLENNLTGLIYNEFAENNGLILLYSQNGLYQIPLKDENNEIWKDYLNSGDYNSALKCVEDNKKLNRRISRISAEDDFYSKDYLNSVMKYVLSDEHFEIVSLRYFMKNQIDALKLYWELYLDSNVNKTDENNMQANIITTLLINLMLITPKDKKKSTGDFLELLRKNHKYLLKGNAIYNLAKNYGRMEEYTIFGAKNQDYETVIMHYINSGNINEAFKNLFDFFAFLDNNDVINKKRLIEIFLNNCHIFLRNDPKDAIEFIQPMFKEISMEKIIQAIICIMDKEEYNLNSGIKNIKKEENCLTIKKFLKFLIDKKLKSEESNIHNLYIYFLSKSRKNQNELLEYLQNKKHRALFNFDFAKRILLNNPSAYALVLALSGKYSEGIQKALSSQNKDGRNIAEFIANNAPNESLKKQLWIEIFSYDNIQNDFTQALKTVKNSGILKIEDILPHIADTFKIEEMEDFKKKIYKSISAHEKNIEKIKNDINNYQNTSENIRNDISKLNKRSMEIAFGSYKCVICQNYIINQNVHLFPCGHMFDSNCIRECLLNYESTGLEYIHEKNVRIDELFLKLGYIKKSSYENSKLKKNGANSNLEEEKNQFFDFKQLTTNAFNIFSNLYNKVSNSISNSISFLKKQDNGEKVIRKKFKSRDEELAEMELNEILNEQCVLCGDYMVDSIQCSVCRPNKFNPGSDGYKLNLDIKSDWNLLC